MTDIFVVKMSDGTTLMYSSDASAMVPAFGAPEDRAELAIKLASERGVTAEVWGIAQDSQLLRGMLPGDVDIVNGNVVVDALAMEKRKIQKEIDRRTRWLVQGGFECPAPGEVQLAGNGYAVDDVLTVDGGTFTEAATFKVTKVAGNGGVLEVEPISRGDYSRIPSNPARTTGGSGNNARLNVSSVPSRWGTALGGELFSMSDVAQMNWTNAMLMKDNMAYPIPFPNIDDTAYVVLKDANDVVKYYSCGFKKKMELIVLGAATKQSISDANDEASAQTVYANDRRERADKSKPKF